MTSPAFVLFVALALTALSPALAQRTPRTVNVGGQGSASAPPDLATISTGVTTMAKTANESLTENNRRFARVLQVLKSNGIDEKDIQTGFFSVQPQFDRRPNTPPVLTGYRVQNEVNVKVRDLDSLGDVLDALVRAGSNNISGINFSLEDSADALEEARMAAIMDANTRAQTYAKAARVRVGRVLAISETSIPTPKATRFAVSADAPSTVPVATGELTVNANVFVLYELR